MRSSNSVTLNQVQGDHSDNYTIDRMIVKGLLKHAEVFEPKSIHFYGPYFKQSTTLKVGTVIHEFVHAVTPSFQDHHIKLDEKEKLLFSYRKGYMSFKEALENADSWKGYFVHKW